MEVILRQAVESLGKPGDVVKVSNGYARNFLLPRGIAFEATQGNLKRIAQEKSRLEAAENERRAAAQTLAERLEQVSLSARSVHVEDGLEDELPPGGHVIAALKRPSTLVPRL